MSTKPVTYWTVVCDRCGVDAFKDDEFSAYAAQADAAEVLTDMAYNDGGWLVVVGPDHTERHYCEGCTTWDEENDERVPLPAVES
jgi:hypothetical protein